MEKTIKNFVEEISKRRGKVIDDFLKAYIASRFDYSKNPEEIIKRLVLVEKIVERGSNGLVSEFYFKLKSGKLKK